MNYRLVSWCGLLLLSSFCLLRRRSHKGWLVGEALFRGSGKGFAVRSTYITTPYVPYWYRYLTKLSTDSASDGYTSEHLTLIGLPHVHSDNNHNIYNPDSCRSPANDVRRADHESPYSDSYLGRR